MLDWPAIMDVLKRAGFDGVLSVACSNRDEAARSLRYVTHVLETAAVPIG